MVVEWPVIKELMAIRDRLELCLSGGLAPGGERAFGEAVDGRFCPRADFYEDDEQVIVVAELAGVIEGDIEISVDQGRLRVAGCTPQGRAQAAGGSFLRMERPSGRFFRDFVLPLGVEVGANAVGRLEKGVLTVRLAKQTAVGTDS